MGWFFTAIVVFTTQPASKFLQGPFATQQECESQKAVLKAQMPGIQPTPCTHERIADMKGATKPPAAASNP